MNGFSRVFSSPSYGSGGGYPSGQTDMALQSLDWNLLIVKPLEKYVINIVAFIPDLLTALCIILAGWVIGKILQLVVSLFLGSMGFDQFAQKIGFGGWSDSEGKSIAPHRYVGLATFWATLFISVIMSLDQLRLRMMSAYLDQFLQFVLSLFIALVILVVGMFMSLALSKIIQTTALHLKMANADRYASVAKWAVLVFSVLVCLRQLGLPTDVFFIGLAIVFVSLCLICILAFGIGGRGWAGKVLESTLKERKD